MIRIGDDPRAMSMPDIHRALEGLESQIPKALAQTITFTAERVQADLVQGMSAAFQAPTPFTLRGVWKTTATPSRLYAEVKLKDYLPNGTAPARYLAPQIAGGARSDKRTESLLRMRGFISGDQAMVPGDDAPLDRYGNIPKAQVVKALSNINAQQDRYQNTDFNPAGTARKRQHRSGRQYFWMNKVGIFWREARGGLRSFMVIAKRPQYDRRFDFYGISERSVERHLPEQTQRSIDRVLRKAAEGRDLTAFFG